MTGKKVQMMAGVREYAEGMDVNLAVRDGRVVIDAWNEGGHNITEVDLADLIGWLRQHLPHLLTDAQSDPPIEPQAPGDGQARETPTEGATRSYPRPEVETTIQGHWDKGASRMVIAIRSPSGTEAVALDGDELTEFSNDLIGVLWNP
jgi:hypothetical protein